MARKKRLSRPLLGILGVVLVVGTTVTIHKLTRTQSANAAPQPVVAAGADPSGTVKLPLVTPLAKSGTSASTGIPAPLITAAPTSPVTPGAISKLSPPATVAPIGDPSASQATKTPATKPSQLVTSPVVPRITSVDAPLRDSQTLIADGKLIEARLLLNDALISRKSSAEQERQIKQNLAEINQSVVFSPKKFSEDSFATVQTVKPGDRLAKIAGEHDLTWEFLARINNISDPAKLRAGANLKVITGPFHGVVDKSDFTLDIYLGSPGEKGSIYVSTLNVGLGKEDSTPTGTWIVKLGSKLKNPKFWGAGGLAPIEADDPTNPLGEFWIGLEGTDGAAINQDGYGIHGTIEPMSIGKQASLGCIRLADADIRLVYELLVEGKSTVIVKP